MPSRRYTIVSTFPPTPCGVATFSATLRQGLEAGGAAVDSVALGDDGSSGPSSPAAQHALGSADVVIVQHEYGIYDGPDGDAVVELVQGLERPSILVTHTVLQSPTAHQREVLEAAAASADAVVVMTEAGRDRLCATYSIDARKVTVIPHGAAVSPAREGAPRAWGPGALLTWGLLGPGKGIECAIDALALLRDVLPRPTYVIAGDTHPKVAALDGEAYRDMLQRRAEALGVARQVHFDPGYRGLPALADLLQAAAVVVLPYDSPDQVTSGVLVDAVAAGRPVVATAFPHAVELLGGGAGLVVPRRDPVALAGALRHVLTEPELAQSMAAEARRLAPGLAWSAIASRYAALGDGLVADRGPAGVNDPTAFRHIATMTDRYGTFEHADHAVPRLEHGYCVDDMARVLLVASREPEPSPVVTELARRSLRFLAEAQGTTGRTRNRRSADGRWHGRRAVEDCWGRSVWGLGVAATSTRGYAANSTRTYFDHTAQQRSRWPRAMAFAALGAAAVLDGDDRAPRARRLLADCTEMLLALRATTSAAGWIWPEDRLTYANAALPEALLAAGHHLDRPDVVDRGLELLGWLLARETHGGHLSVTPAGGSGPLDVAPGFDQQPIEVAAMADACARAAHLTGDTRWVDGLRLAGAWFDGDNDARAVMWDPATGGGFDGLCADGPNRNQGTESTLALISTRQHVTRLDLLTR